MKLCTQTGPFNESLEEVLGYVSNLGINSVSVPCTSENPAGIDPAVYLDDSDAQATLQELFASHGMDIGVLSVGAINPLHPDEEQAAEDDDRLRKAIALADQLDVGIVTSFSGLPGGSPHDVTPNWIVTPVPPAWQLEAHDYQWNDVAIPYWAGIGDLADEHEVDIAIELHINTLVNGPTQLIRLRNETSERINGYIDPPHLVLQGIDPIESIQYLNDNDALIHFEASDVRVDERNRRLKGYTDMTGMHEPLERSWLFCTVGYGLGEEFWREIISTLQIIEYDGLVNVQQLHTPEPFRDGLEKATELLQQIII